VTSPASDAKAIIEAIRSSIPERIDGKTAIQDMKNGGSNNWRQMEWIGFWFEYFVESRLFHDLGAQRGPRYGQTEFDLYRHFVWDLKAHPDARPDLILNDQEAVHKCIQEYEGLGFIVLEGQAEMDTTGEFRAWHSEFKGGQSAYERKGEAEGRVSRTRKTSFTPLSATAVFIPNESSIEQALKDGWLKPFQQGMRNSNGVARRGKYQFSSLEQIPEQFVVAHESLVGVAQNSSRRTVPISSRTAPVHCNPKFNFDSFEQDTRHRSAVCDMNVDRNLGELNNWLAHWISVLDEGDEYALELPFDLPGQPSVHLTETFDKREVYVVFGFRKSPVLLDSRNRICYATVVVPQGNRWLAFAGYWFAYCTCVHLVDLSMLSAVARHARSISGCNVKQLNSAELPLEFSASSKWFDGGILGGLQLWA
jgi:hypothetical protein